MLKSTGFLFGLNLQHAAIEPVPRQLRHRRAGRAEAYERGDGQWTSSLLTITSRAMFAASGGIRPQGQPIHELWLRVTIDR
jgi:hypothetical protein